MEVKLQMQYKGTLFKKVAKMLTICIALDLRVRPDLCTPGIPIAAVSFVKVRLLFVKNDFASTIIVYALTFDIVKDVQVSFSDNLFIYTIIHSI